MELKNWTKSKLVEQFMLPRSEKMANEESTLSAKLP